MPDPVTYQYDPADPTKFPNGFNPDGLKHAINASQTVSIHCIDVLESGGMADVVMADDLEDAVDPPQLDALEAILPAHDVDYSTPKTPRPVQEANPGPTTADGVPIKLSNHIPRAHYFWGTGAFDDFQPTPPASGRGSGELISWQTNGDAGDVATKEGRFFEHVYILGGTISSKNGDFGDHVSLDVIAPASAPEARPGNDGNASKVELYSGAPVSLFVPTQAADGAWEVDGAAMEAGQVNANLVPVPARDADDNPVGWWDWDPDQTPSITPNYDQQGGYNLFDQELKLARQANCYPVMAPHQSVTPEAAVKGKKILPHWLWRFTLVRGDEPGAVKVAIRLDTARKLTT